MSQPKTCHWACHCRAIGCATASRLALLKAVLSALHEHCVLASNAVQLLDETQMLGLLAEVSNLVWLRGDYCGRADCCG